LSAVCRRFHVRQLDLFGSATREGYANDLDFLVTFDPLSPSEYAAAYFGLREALEGMFDREIDLVTEPSLANPYFRRRVEAERQPLFRSE